MRRIRRGLCSSRYAEKVRQLSGVTLPQNRFAQVLSRELLFETQRELSAPLTALDPLNPSPSFDLSDEDYLAAVGENLFGGFEIFQLGAHTLYLVGMNYANVPAANLWKMLEWARPDALLLHLPPDELLPDFSLNLRNPRTAALSNRRYFAQLVFAPGEFCPDPARAEGLGRELGDGGQSEPTAARRRTAEGYECRAKLNDEVVAVCALFSRRRGVPVVLADLPDIVHRQRLVCGLTVSQLRQILRQAVLDGVFNPDFSPAFPLHLASIAQPGLLLRASDHYTASLLQYAMRRQPFKRLFAFLGCNQARSVKSLLLGRAPLPLAHSLETPPPRENVLGEASLEELVEKLVLYDVLKHGSRQNERGELRYRNTWAVIEKFTGLSPAEPKARYYAYLYKQLMREQLKLLEQHRAEARQRLRESFAQVVIKNPEA